MTKTNPKKIENSTMKMTSLWVWIVLAVVAVIIITFFFIPKSQTGIEKMPAVITVEEAAKLREKGAFMLDVREQSEWDQFHIPNASLIPLGTLPEQLAKVPKDQIVVVVCRTGHRSAQGRDILLKAGYANVTSMGGGVTEWQIKGLPIESGN
jgi:rhodanese-related sulfurtransferase